MTSAKKKESYITVDLAELVPDSTIPFDCYLNLAKNQKELKWIKAGQKFTEQHLAKILQNQMQSILVRASQESLLNQYRDGKTRSSGTDKPAATTFKSGGVSVNSTSAENTKSSKIEKNDVIIVKSLTPTVPQSNIQIVKSQPKSPGSLAANKMSVDVNFLNPFILSTQQAFEQFCKSQVQFRPPSPRSNRSQITEPFEVASLISLVSESIRGSIALCFPASSFLYTMTQMCGQNIVEISPELVDGAGELINFIFESARFPLIEDGYPLERSVPTLIYGNDLSLPHLITDPGFSIVFDSLGGPFQFEVGIKTSG